MGRLRPNQMSSYQIDCTENVLTNETIGSTAVPRSCHIWLQVLGLLVGLQQIVTEFHTFEHENGPVLLPATTPLS